MFEGKVSTDVEPHELVLLRFFWMRYLDCIYNKATNEQVNSFKGLRSNVELNARDGGKSKTFSGVLYVCAADGVLRKSKSVPSRECVLMSVWFLSHEESEKAFKCEMLEELEMNWCKLRQIPSQIGKMKKLKKLTLYGLYDLKSIPEEIGELSNLEELWMGYGGIESLPKRLKDLKMLKSISLSGLYDLLLSAEDLVLFSKLRHLRISYCCKVYSPPFICFFWEMIKSTTDIRAIDLNWNDHNQDMVTTSLKENGSIIDGGENCESYIHFFKRNKANYERALQCVVHILAIRRCRNFYNNVPKEMFHMLSMMLWNTRSDVKGWSK